MFCRSQLKAYLFDILRYACKPYSMHFYQIPCYLLHVDSGYKPNQYPDTLPAVNRVSIHHNRLVRKWLCPEWKLETIHQIIHDAFPRLLRLRQLGQCLRQRGAFQSQHHATTGHRHAARKKNTLQKQVTFPAMPMQLQT